MLSRKTAGRATELKETPSEARTVTNCWKKMGTKKANRRTPQELWPLHWVWGSGGPQNGDKSGSQENWSREQAAFAEVWGTVGRPKGL